MFHSSWSLVLLKLPFNIVWLHKIASNMGRFNLRGNCYMTITEWFCLLPYPWISSKTYLQCFLTEISTLPQFACLNWLSGFFFLMVWTPWTFSFASLIPVKLVLRGQLQMESASLRPHLQQFLCTACGEHSSAAVSVYCLWGALTCHLSLWVYLWGARPWSGFQQQGFPSAAVSVAALSFRWILSL